MLVFVEFAVVVEVLEDALCNWLSSYRTSMFRVDGVIEVFDPIFLRDVAVEEHDLNWPSMISTQVVFFNSNVAKEYQVENLYDAVNAGTWTFDKMRTIAKGISQDLNNDGKFDENDKFGITMCYYGAVYEIGIAANYITVAQDDGRLKMNVDTEKFADIVNYAIDLIYSEGTTYIERV